MDVVWKEWTPNFRAKNTYFTTGKRFRFEMDCFLRESLNEFMGKCRKMYIQHGVGWVYVRMGQTR